VDQTGSTGRMITLQLVSEMLPSHAVVNPTGHGVQGNTPDEFL
jgi:hypothetical protein